MRPRGLHAVFVGLALLGSPLASLRAQEPPKVEDIQAQSQPQADPEAQARARELYNNGAGLYEEGLYADAIAAFEEAYRLSRQPLLLFNIANAYERLGDYQEAMDALNRYRAFAPKEERDSLLRRISNIEARLAEEKSKESEATATPTPAPLPPSEPIVEGDSALTPPLTSEEPEPGTLPPHSSGRMADIPLWVPVVSGASLVMIGLGAGAGSRSLNFTQEASAFCLNVDSGQLICSAEAAAPLDSAHRYALIADTAISLGVGAAIAGGVGFMRYRFGGEGLEDGQRRDARIAPWLKPGFGGLQLTGHF